MKVYAGEAERGRDQRARLPSVGPEGLAVLVELGVEAARAPAIEHLLHRCDIHSEKIGEGLEVRGERDDDTDIQVAVGPAVQSFPDAGRERIIDGRMAEGALNAHRPDLACLV